MFKRLFSMRRIGGATQAEAKPMVEAMEGRWMLSGSPVSGGPHHVGHGADDAAIEVRHGGQGKDDAAGHNANDRRGRGGKDDGAGHR